MANSLRLVEICFSKELNLIVVTVVYEMIIVNSYDYRLIIYGYHSASIVQDLHLIVLMSYADDEIQFVSLHSSRDFCLCQFVPIDLPTNLPVYQVSDDSYNGSIVDGSSACSIGSILLDTAITSIIRLAF